jgi:beta-glucosidase
MALTQISTTRKCIFLALVAAHSLQNIGAQPYKNARLPIAQRVEDLLQRMTAEEKFYQCFMVPGDVKTGEAARFKSGLFGFQVSATAAGSGPTAQLLTYNANDDARALAAKINRIQRVFVEQSRLGIPIIAFDEALHGLVRGGATAFPQSIALAATWDTALMSRVAHTIARESKLRGIRQILSPVINLANDVRWGRTEETYGEDPYLSAVMGTAFMGAFERLGVITTPKHFLANVGEGGRDSYPIHWSQWYLQQTHLMPFEWAFKKAGARSVMTAYNSLNGTPSTSNTWLLNDWLKKQQAFTGFVISDASATGGAIVLHMTSKDYPQSAKHALEGGLDVIFQTDINSDVLFNPHFLDGTIDSNRINDAVRRVLRAKFELGLFENPYVDETNLVERLAALNAKEIAREAAAKSVVLLQNGGMLPLKQSVKSVAVIGEDAITARLGGYSGPGNGKINILQGLKAALPQTRISYAAGYQRDSHPLVPIPATALSHFKNGQWQTGLQAEYFNNLELAGKPVVERIDQQINFRWTLYAPDEKLNRDFFAVRWTGYLESPKTATITLGLEGNDGYRLYLNDSLVIDRWNKRTHFTATIARRLVANTRYKIRIEFKEPWGNAAIGLVWSQGSQHHWRQLQQQAVAAAKSADAVVLVAGIHEGEFQDRAFLGLDYHQEELITALAATGKPVTVLLVGGSAITMPWLQKVNAVAMVWYPGEEGGHAVADVLTGKMNPAGRLPISFPIHEAQLPLSYWHLPTGRGDGYHNLSGEALFPFGFGLSYTQFAYSNLRLASSTLKPHEKTTVELAVQNTGSVDGEEVVQLYLRDELASVARPVLELKAFQRIFLRSGQQQTVRFEIEPDMLYLWNVDNERVLEPGDFSIMIGASSKDLRLKTLLTVLP